MIKIIDHDVIAASYPVTYQSVEFVRDNETGAIVRHRGQPVTRPIEEVRMREKFHYRFTVESVGEILPTMRPEDIVARFGSKPFRRAKREYLRLAREEIRRAIELKSAVAEITDLCQSP